MPESLHYSETKLIFGSCLLFRIKFGFQRLYVNVELYTIESFGGLLRKAFRYAQCARQVLVSCEVAYI